MQTKICSKCGRELPLDNFYKNKSKKYGVEGECKDCFKARVKEYYEQNKEKISLRTKEYQEKNKEQIKLDKKEYYEKNKEKLSLQKKEYYENNKEARKKKANEYRNKRLKEDKFFAFTHRVRNLIRISISKKGYTKRSKTSEIVGCTFEQLKEHLENTWYNNYGTPYNGEPVHIDHIIPLSSAKNEEDVIKLCHYTNLQYLKPEDNLKKHNKIDYVLE